jgi:hypothetical protein
MNMLSLPISTPFSAMFLTSQAQVIELLSRSYQAAWPGVINVTVHQWEKTHVMIALKTRQVHFTSLFISYPLDEFTGIFISHINRNTVTF